MSRKHKAVVLSGHDSDSSSHVNSKELQDKVNKLQRELDDLQDRYDKLKESHKTLKKNYKKIKGADENDEDKGDGLTKMKTFKSKAPPKMEIVKKQKWGESSDDND